MVPWKSKHRLVLGITGGIAAYKGPEIVRAMKKNGLDVKVVLSKSAESFVSPMVLSTLSGNRTHQEQDFLSGEKGWEIPHIALAEWAEAIVIAPCTASMLQRAATGNGDTLLGALLLATRASVVLFPAMNVNMWEHSATRSNTRKVEELGYQIVVPDSGFLACGYEGKGRLPGTEVIVEETLRALCPQKDLTGKKVMVTAGPTWEFLDPVRFISNPSSGKMGFALARSAWLRGANVTVICGPTTTSPPYGVKVEHVTSAEEMLKAALRHAENSDIIFKAAAVGDYRSELTESGKIKRDSRDTLDLRLVQNPDIAAELGKRKRHGQILVGFAAETEEIIQNARGKMARKGLDFIVANDLTAEGAGFQSDTNTVSILASAGGPPLVLSGSKDEVAYRIIDTVLEIASSIKG